MVGGDFVTAPRAGKPHPRFGATATQTKHAQEIRDLKNRIHELEVQLAVAVTNGVPPTCAKTGRPLGPSPVSMLEYVRVTGIAEGLTDALRMNVGALVLASGKVPS